MSPPPVIGTAGVGVGGEVVGDGVGLGEAVGSSVLTDSIFDI